MNPTRWIQFGVVLVAAFVLSVGAGALIGRQRTAPPAASVPTPTPAPSVLVTPTVLVTPPTAPPTPTSAASTTPSAAPPTASPTSPPALDPATAEEFASKLLVAFQSGDTTYLLERLHPFVLERYGERQCRREVNGYPPDPSASWTVQSSTGPAPWDWVTDDLTTTVSDTWTVIIEIPDAGRREVHFAPFEGTWRWFVDCTPS